MTVTQDTNSPPDATIVARAAAVIAITVAPIALCILLASSPIDGGAVRRGDAAVSRYDASSLEAKLSRALQDSGHRETVRITDAELTSYLVLRAGESCIESPQVRFEDGRVRLSGTLTGPFLTEFPLRVVLTDDRSRDGPCIAVYEARLGALQVPPVALPLADKALEGLLGGWGARISWERLRVVDGAIEITIRQDRRRDWF